MAIFNSYFDITRGYPSPVDSLGCYPPPSSLFFCNVLVTGGRWYISYGAWWVEAMGESQPNFEPRSNHQTWVGRLIQQCYIMVINSWMGGWSYSFPTLTMCNPHYLMMLNEGNQDKWWYSQQADVTSRTTAKPDHMPGHHNHFHLHIFCT